MVCVLAMLILVGETERIQKPKCNRIRDQTSIDAEEDIDVGKDIYIKREANDRQRNSMW